MRPEILLQAGVAIVTGALYAWIAYVVHRRDLSAEARAANDLFVVWWAGLALVYAGSALNSMTIAVGLRSLPLSLAITDLILVILCVALWGLLGYLLYLYTGSRRAFIPLAVAYAALGLSLLYIIAWREPTGFRDGPLGVTLTYARELPPLVGTLLGLAVSGPIAIAALAYGSLYFRVREPEPRYRIAMVAGGFLAWFGWSIVSTIARLGTRYPDSLTLYAVNHLVALLVPLVVLAAYRPPAWIAERLRRPA